MKKILILGGNGFVGKNVCEVFDENNINYSVASRNTGVDLRDLKQCLQLFDKIGPDFIINCAAHVGSLNYVSEIAATIVVDNTKMIISIYEAVEKICPKAIVINPIANCAYPAKSETFIEDQLWNGQLHRSVLSYGGTRRLMWLVAECYKMQYGVKSINLLVPNMYGPYDSTDPNKAHALNALISKFVKNNGSHEKNIEIWGTGAAIREWLYAKDFGKIILEIIKNPMMLGLSEPVNIAQNYGLSVKELVEIIRLFFDNKIKIEYNFNKPDGAPKKIMDNTKFTKVFPKFKFTNMKKGIKNTIAYYESISPY